MPASTDSTVLLDQPDNLCFGCSPHNPHGLRIVWARRGRDGVEAHYTTDRRFGGAPGVVHGGIQATLLDETIGIAIHEALDDPDDLHIVTVDFTLRYRRPVPTERTVVLRGLLERHEGRDYYGTGEIRSLDGTLLTESTARWRRIESAPPR